MLHRQTLIFSATCHISNAMLTCYKNNVRLAVWWRDELWAASGARQLTRPTPASFYSEPHADHTETFHPREYKHIVSVEPAINLDIDIKVDLVWTTATVSLLCTVNWVMSSSLTSGFCVHWPRFAYLRSAHLFVCRVTWFRPEYSVTSL